MHFKQDDPRWSWRLAYFQSVVLPKILAQTDQDFDICMRVNEHHAEEVKALSDKIKVFDVKPEKRGWVKPGYAHKMKRYFVDFIPFEDTVGLDRYDIQIGLDSDDMPLKDYFVERIKNEFAEYPDRTQHLSFQPHIFHTPSLRMYKCPVEYGAKHGSAIFAIYQPQDRDQYLFAYHDSHLKMPSYFESARRIEEDFCCYSVHDHNSSTGLLPNAKQILV